MQNSASLARRPDNRIWFDPPLTEAKLHAGRKGQATKDYLEKVAMLVPMEVVAAYQMLISFIPGIQPKEWQPTFYWVCFGIGLIGTAAYTGWRIGDGWKKSRHLLVYMAAFAVWAYAISGVKLFNPPYYQEAFAGILLVVASLLFGNIKLPLKPVNP